MNVAEAQSSVASENPSSTPLAQIRAGDLVNGVYACSKKDRLTAKTGQGYLAMELRDRSGSLPARVFRHADVIAGRFERGDLVQVQGRAERFRGEIQLELDAVERSVDGDPNEFLPVAYRDRDELDGFLEHLASEVYDVSYRGLLDRMLADEELRKQWRSAPCTRDRHNAYLGGLLEHTVAVATLALELTTLHPKLNSDLLICAALVHDIGKTREFKYGADIDYSSEGKSLGHIPISLKIIDFYSEDPNSDKHLALAHCVLGHHGADRLPNQRFASPEALALYKAHALETSVKGALEHGLPE